MEIMWVVMREGERESARFESIRSEGALRNTWYNTIRYVLRYSVIARVLCLDGEEAEVVGDAGDGVLRVGFPLIVYR